MKVERTEIAGVLRSAVFSDGGDYRYALGRVWDKDLPPAVFIGLNPSIADAIKDDPTIRRCMSFAKRWGLGGLLMVNLFAYRSTDPARLALVADPIGPDNFEFCATMVLREGPAIIVAAWGAHKLAGGQAMRWLSATGVTSLQCLGKNRDGSPKHPLYVPGSTKPRSFP